MSKQVLEQYKRVASLLTSGDHSSTCEAIREGERIIDSMEVKLHSDIMHALVLYSPRATEGRLVISYYDITTNLERIGDLLFNAYKHITKSDREGQVFQTMLPYFQSQFARVEQSLQTSLFAFSCAETKTAREVISSDDIIDSKRDEIERVLPRLVAEYGRDESEALTGMRLYLLSYSLERIGDHACNIAEAIIFTYIGDYVKHAEPSKFDGAETDNQQDEEIE